MTMPASEAGLIHVGTIEVGDVIRVTNGFGRVTDYPVVRVTKAYAFVRWNEHAEGKFHRRFGTLGPRRCPRPDTWSSTRYEHVPKGKA